MRRLGLDVGTNCIGWCLIEDDERIVDIGVRIPVIEYKGDQLYGDEGPKRTIGAVWAEASGGDLPFLCADGP